MFGPLASNTLSMNYALGYDDYRYPKVREKPFDPWAIDQYPVFDTTISIPKQIHALETQEFGSYAACKAYDLGLQPNVVVFCARVKMNMSGANTYVYDVYHPKSGWYIRVYDRWVYSKNIPNTFGEDHFKYELNSLLGRPDLNDWHRSNK